MKIRPAIVAILLASRTPLRIALPLALVLLLGQGLEKLVVFRAQLAKCFERLRNLAPVVIGPAMPLALWLAANALLKSVRGWMKASLAVRTAAGLGQCVSSEIERDSNF